MNKNDEPKKKEVRWICLYILVIIGIAGLINLLMSPSIPSISSIGAPTWLNFWGSYLGGAIGCLPAIAALQHSRREARRQHEENEKSRRLGALPVFACTLNSASLLIGQAENLTTLSGVIHLSQERGLYCQFYKGHKILVERVCEGTTIDPDLANTTAIEVGSFENYDFQPSPKAMIVAPPEKVAAYQRELDAYLSGGAYLAQSQPYLIEIMPKGVNKASSLALLCRRLGIAQSEVMACGDNTNDAEMVSWAGTGVAVANAIDSLKKAASYVCQAERSLGVAEAIEKFCQL